MRQSPAQSCWAQFGRRHSPCLYHLCQMVAFPSPPPCKVMALWRDYYFQLAVHCAGGSARSAVSAAHTTAAHLPPLVPLPMLPPVVPEVPPPGPELV